MFSCYLPLQTNHMRSLTDFVDAQASYYAQCNQHAQELQKQLARSVQSHFHLQKRKKNSFICIALFNTQFQSTSQFELNHTCTCFSIQTHSQAYSLMPDWPKIMGESLRKSSFLKQMTLLPDLTGRGRLFQNLGSPTSEVWSPLDLK